jgi:hypothetical protein
MGLMFKEIRTHGTVYITRKSEPSEAAKSGPRAGAAEH